MKCNTAAAFPLFLRECQHYPQKPQRFTYYGRNVPFVRQVSPDVANMRYWVKFNDNGTAIMTFIPPTL